MFDIWEKVFGHPWSPPTLAGLCLAVVVGAMGTVSVVVLVLERGAARQAALEENVRLALWRMDSALAPIIAEENARPYFTYSPFYPAERAYTRMFRRMDYGEVLIPSPLLTFKSPMIRMHFQIEPDGHMTSPQVPMAHLRELAESGYTTHQQIADDVDDFERLKVMINRDKVEAALAAALQGPAGLAREAEPARGDVALGEANAPASKGVVEYGMRQQANAQNTVGDRQEAGLASRATIEGVFRPVWIEGNLFVVRHVNVDGQNYLQGCWFKWAETRAWLLSQVHDLLPGAGLIPAGEVPAGDSQHSLSRQLAGLPIVVAPGEPPEVVVPVFSALRASLLFLWAGLILATLAGAILLRGALLLSERRAAFVSAVTHELRTPLTTFRLYSQMLSQGMVRDPGQQAVYLKTLEAESDRLAHLVENVLSYARLERVGPVGEGQPIRLEQLLTGMTDRLGQRASQGGMTLAVDVPGELLGLSLQAEPAGVEQALFNLVDNACKYAAGASDRRVHLEASRRRGWLTLRVRDHGPGIGADVRERLFRPFSKSAQVAAGSTPGVGLGLALALRYARHMGGELEWEKMSEPGACFAMRLKVVG